MIPGKDARRLPGWVTAIVFAAGTTLGAAENLAARVIVLANRDDPGSMRIARHYAMVRGVPEANILALKLPPTEIITWREFIGMLWQPLLEQLVAAQWIDATPMALTDAIGRRKYAPREHRIAALVICRGVPLKIAHEPEFFAENLPITRRAEFRTNAGSVDGELSLLAQPNYPINGLVQNPLFNLERPSPFQMAQVVKVARLDGPTVEDANTLVDRAVAAERTGLLGRAYVDLAQRDRVGDTWLESTAAQLVELGFDTSVDREASTMPATARSDAPVLYFGWYANEISGPFALPGFRFPPGAIALHIQSFTASTLRQPTGAWSGSLVARGVTATVGNVYEPYLLFTHRPDLLLRALARGETLVDAAYYSLQALSWQAVLIGDPLYRPFAISFEQQWNEVASLPPPLAAYAVMRKVRLLDAAGRYDDATKLALASLQQRPHLALAVTLALRAREKGESGVVLAALKGVPREQRYEPDEWALAREAALLQESIGGAARACEIWSALLAATEIPREIRLAWLTDAIRVARDANDRARAVGWENERTLLSTLR